MKLSIEIIKEHLTNVNNPAVFNCSDNALLLERPIFYVNQTILKSHTLYMGYSKDLPSSLRVEKHAALILIGKPSGTISNMIDNLLVFEEGSDLLTLSNQVNQVFDLFDNWERTLLSIPYHAPFRNIYQQLLDASSDVFENGISLMNNNFMIIFENETNIAFGGYDDFHGDDQFAISQDIISFFKYDKEYQKITTKKEVFYYNGDALPHRVLCKNIFRNDQFLFRIILTECIRPFRRSDEVLLDYLSDHVIHSLQQMNIPDNASNEGLPKLFSEAIETRMINRQAIESELRKLSWSYTDTFRVASIHASSDDLYLSTLSYFSLEIMNLFPGTFAFQNQDQIIVIINETKAGPVETYADRLSVFVRENNFRVGVSNFTDDIYKFQTLHRQAEMALTIGLTEKPMEWIHWFSRYTLQYIYNMLTSNSDLGQLYSPIYYRLERYDKENGSSYLETLRVYLNCNMNAVQAAKELYIQRSTMIYRLKRIREIADNDLETRDDLLHLYLTFSIIDWENTSHKE